MAIKGEIRMSLESLTLLTKLEELDTYSHKALVQFPKYEKFVLCAEIRQTLTAIIRRTVPMVRIFSYTTTRNILNETILRRS